MRTVRVSVELEDDKFQAFEQEAERQGRTVEDVVGRAIRLIMRDFDKREKEELEPPIFLA